MTAKEAASVAPTESRDARSRSATTRSRRCLVCVVAVSSWVGCGTHTNNDSAPAPVEQCVAGDPTQPLAFDIVYRSADGALMPCTEMSEIPLFPAPQGG